MALPLPRCASVASSCATYAGDLAGGDAIRLAERRRLFDLCAHLTGDIEAAEGPAQEVWLMGNVLGGVLGNHVGLRGAIALGAVAGFMACLPLLLSPRRTVHEQPSLGDEVPYLPPPWSLSACQAFFLINGTCRTVVG